MQAGVLITNGGPHPADKWAEVSAEQIVALIDIDDNSISEQAEAARRAKRRFKNDLIDALEGHHKAIIHGERRALVEHGEARYGHSLKVAEHHPETLEEACNAVVEAASKDPLLADHFKQAHVAEVVQRILHSHMSHAMDIERSWHKDLGGKVFGGDQA